MIHSIHVWVHLGWNEGIHNSKIKDSIKERKVNIFRHKFLTTAYKRFYFGIGYTTPRSKKYNFSHHMIRSISSFIFGGNYLFRLAFRIIISVKIHRRRCHISSCWNARIRVRNFTPRRSGSRIIREIRTYTIYKHPHKIKRSIKTFTSQK